MGRLDVMEDADMFYMQSLVSSMMNGQPVMLAYDVITMTGHLIDKMHRELPEVHDNVMGGLRKNLENSRKKYEGKPKETEFCNQLEKMLNAVEAYHMAYKQWDDWVVQYDKESQVGCGSPNPFRTNK